jgi:hypothetical protein
MGHRYHFQTIPLIGPNRQQRFKTRNRLRSKSLSETEEVPLVGPFAACLRWFDEHSPLRGHSPDRLDSHQKSLPMRTSAFTVKLYSRYAIPWADLSKKIKNRALSETAQEPKPSKEAGRLNLLLAESTPIPIPSEPPNVGRDAGIVRPH